eukprot:978081-Amphidinium_carterae.1
MAGKSGEEWRKEGKSFEMGPETHFLPHFLFIFMFWGVLGVLTGRGSQPALLSSQAQSCHFRACFSRCSKTRALEARAGTNPQTPKFQKGRKKV